LIRQIMDRKSTAMTTDTTYANLMNLAPSFKEQVVASYEGTRIGRQELMGEMLTDVDGALWSLENIDDLRVELEP
jgi:phage terminase large subunit-like protein